MKLLIFVFSLFAALPLTVSAQVFTLSDDTFEVAVNSPSSKSKTITATAAAGTTFLADAKIEWKGLDGFISVSAPTRTSDTIIKYTFTAVKAVTNKTITANLGGQTENIVVTVKPELSKATVSPQLSTAEKVGLSIVRSGVRNIPLRITGTTATASSLVPQSSDATKVTAVIDGTNLKITAVAEGTATITLTGNGDPIGDPLIVTVKAGIDISSFPSPIVIERGKEEKVDLKAKFNNVDLTSLIISQPLRADVAKISGSDLISVGPGTTTFKVQVKDVETPRPITVEVKPKAETIVLSGLNNRKSLIKGNDWDINAKVKGEGREIEADVSLTSADTDCVIVDELGSNRFTLKAGSDFCDSVILTATATVDGKELTQTFTVSPKAVTGFKPLKIRLDMLDGQTSRDLFGKKATDEYFIAKIRLFNNLKESDKVLGDSILVYSESLEVMVAVEWREEGAKGQQPLITDKYDEATNTWRRVPLTDKDGNQLYTDASEWQTLDKATAQSWFPTAQLTNGRRDPKSPCQVIEQANMFVPYRPLTFDMVSNTQDRRDMRSWRSRLLTAINGLTSMTTFITTVAVPKSSNDLKPGLDNFRNLIIPNFEKLFPSYNEVQRQNITSMVMRPLEEVPYGSDVTRILFFPKRKIAGVLANRSNARKTELRISAISISDACADVGIITKVRNGNEPDTGNGIVRNN